MGGFNGSLRVRTVDMYDPTADSWSSIASMEARRSTLGVAVMNDHIYAVGGFDGSCGLNTAEVLDMSVSGTHEWRTIASMSTRRSSVGVGVLCGLIYAVGGYDGNSRQCLASVEVYNQEQDIWSPVADMSARRSVLIGNIVEKICVGKFYQWPTCLPGGQFKVCKLWKRFLLGSFNSG